MIYDIAIIGAGPAGLMAGIRATETRILSDFESPADLRAFEFKKGSQKLTEAHATHGDIFVLRTDRLSIEDRVLLLTAARVVFLSRQGTLAQQMERIE